MARVEEAVLETESRSVLLEDMKRLRDGIDSLHSEISGLESKLCTVMRPASPEDSSHLQALEADRSPLGEDLVVACGTLRGARARIAELVDRLEL